MLKRFSVSAECPSCGAPLDFSVGSNAVSCSHCRSNLLITGRGKVLSYCVQPQLDVHRAVARVMVAPVRSGVRVIKPRLYFIPYHNFTGYELRWERIKETPAESMLHGEGGSWMSLDPEEYTVRQVPVAIGEIVEAAGEFFRAVFSKGKKGVPAEDPPCPASGMQTAAESKPFRGAHAAASPALCRGLQLRDRYVTRSSLALDMDGTGMYSLGVRPGVVRLELFRRDKVEALGRVVRPRVSAETLMSQVTGMETEPECLYRTVLAKTLSLIYFPYWVVECEWRRERSLTIVDAVSGSVVRRDASITLLEILDETEQSAPAVVGFRQLICPNCGWDLPVRPDDVIFFCSSCRKAWQIRQENLNETAYRVADGGDSDTKKQFRYLPLWEVPSVSGEDSAETLPVPAWRYRRLKTLVELAVRLSGRPMSNALPDTLVGDFVGCYYDEDDALLIARFVRAAHMAKTAEDLLKVSEGSVQTGPASLTWIPLEVRGVNLIEPVTGTSLYRDLIW
ncbi:MAG: hypothetical protein ACM3ON_14035 [Chloroflexota bacterium]